MLREDKKARFQTRTVGLFKKRMQWRFSSGELYSEAILEESDYSQLKEQQRTTPMLLMYDKETKKCWWMYQDVFFVEDENYTPEETNVLIMDKAKQRKLKIERAKARLVQGKLEPSSGRQPIPDAVKALVWQRDGGQCVNCGSKKKLEYDHIIPVSKGGGNTERNLQLLCETCNRSKGANLF